MPLIAMLLGVLMLAGGALAQAPAVLPEADRSAIRTVIEDQMAAFQRDDGQAAFAAASPMIQGMFETPERFLAMVRGLYPPVYRPRLVAFGAIVEIGGRLVQKVEIIGPDGAQVLALYTMLRRAEGWYIDGVMLTASEKVAA